MALSSDSSGGSGEFVRVREWTCSEHTYPRDHECDCQYCERTWDCEECATSEWLDAFNLDGTPKMRELSNFEAVLRRTGVAHMDAMIENLNPHLTPFTTMLMELPREGEVTKVTWNEDEAMPPIVKEGVDEG